MSGSLPPTGLFTDGDYGSLSEEAQGTNLVPSTTEEVLGASFSGGLAENPTPRIYRWATTQFDSSPVLSAQEANERFAIPGRLKFDADTSTSVAQDLYDHHHAQAVRDDVIARRQGGVTTGLVARMGAGFAAGLFDPLNIASAFVPGVGEARIAALLGDAAAGTAGRLAVRGIAGATAGVAGQAILEPLNYALAQRDHDDYGMGNVLANLAFGAVLGGGAHAGLGALMERGVPSWAPEAREAALRKGLADLADGRPVDVAAAMDTVSAQSARKELGDFYQSLQKDNAAGDRALAAALTPEDAVAAATARLAPLHEAADSLRADLEGARGRLAEAERRAVDPVTADRIQAIDGELSGTIPRQRRLDLERERQMLTEGRNASVDDLDLARTQAEVTGLEAALARQEARINEGEASLAGAQEAVTTADRALRIQSARLAGREALTSALAERTIRRLAGRLGVELEPGEAAAAASRILRAKPTEVEAVTRAVTDDLVARRNADVPLRPAEEVPSNDGAVAARYDQALRREEGGALDEAARPKPSPVEAAEAQRTELILRDAPDASGTTTEQITTLQKDVERLNAQLDSMKASGEFDAETKAVIDAAAQAEKDLNNLGKAYEVAAACAVRPR